MTVGKLCSIVFKIILIPIVFYWEIRLYIFNDYGNTFDELLVVSNKTFVISFMAFIIYSIIMFATFVIYLSGNSDKSVAIVLSLKYLKNNYTN